MIFTIYFSDKTEAEKCIEDLREYMERNCNVSDFIINNNFISISSGDFQLRRLI